MRGELSEANASLDVRHVLAACDHLATVTGGAFDARRHRADGRIDPSGYVKGWAIEEAAWLLDAAGARNYWINAGGDIVARGRGRNRSAVAGRDPPSGPGRSRGRRPGSLRPGRRDLGRLRARRAHHGPADRSRRRRACAASRSSGPRLAFTDAYATAVFAMGLDGLTWLAATADGDDYAAYAITDDGRAVWTEGMDRYLVRED